MSTPVTKSIYSSLSTATNFLIVPAIQGNLLDDYIRNIVDERIRNTDKSVDRPKTRVFQKLSEDQTSALDVILSNTICYSFSENKSRVDRIDIYLTLSCKRIEMDVYANKLGGPYTGEGDNILVLLKNDDSVTKYIKNKLIERPFKRNIKDWCETMSIKTSWSDINSLYTEVYGLESYKPNEKLFKATILALGECNGIPGQGHNDKFGEMYEKLSCII